MKRKFISIAILALLTQSGSSIPSTYASEVVSGYPELVVSLASVDSEEQSPTDLMQFTDYAIDLGGGKISGHWAEQSGDIQTLINEGGIKGMPNGDGTFRFEPNRPIKVVEFLSLLMNASAKAGYGYQDGIYGKLPIMIETGDGWYRSVFENAILTDIVNENWIKIGNEPITREQMAYVIVGAMEQFTREGTVWQETELMNDYILDIGEAANGEVNCCIKTCYLAGVMQGDDTSHFYPKGSATRAEACAVINRLFKYKPRLDNSKFLELGVYKGTRKDILEKQNALVESAKGSYDIAWGSK